MLRVFPLCGGNGVVEAVGIASLAVQLDGIGEKLAGSRDQEWNEKGSMNHGGRKRS